MSYSTGMFICMPARNAVKTYSANCFYHIYNRGVEKKNIFEADEDKESFLNIFLRYLDPNNVECDSNGTPYQKYNKDIELLSYCVMDNHFHLLVWINENPISMSEFMRSICGTYSNRYNKKHDRVGPLFQGRYKAVLIDNDPQLTYISKYIHMNPGPLSFEYNYSSLRKYLNGQDNLAIDKLIETEKISSLFQHCDYKEFLTDTIAS